MRKAEERREQLAQGQLTEEHTFQPAMPRTPRVARPSTARQERVVRTVSAATQTDRVPTTKAEHAKRRGSQPQSRPGSRPRSSERLNVFTASFAQRATAKVSGVAPVSVPLQTWSPLSLQKDMPSLAALALATIGPVAQVPPRKIVDSGDPQGASPDSPEHAGFVPTGAQHVEEDTAVPSHLCTDSSVEDMQSKSASQPEVERPSVIAQDSLSEDRESTDEAVSIPALRFEDVKVPRPFRVTFSSAPQPAVCHERAPAATRRSCVDFDCQPAVPEQPQCISAGCTAVPCRFSWEEIAPDSASDCGSDSEHLELAGRSSRIQYRSFVLPRVS